jgi:DNA-binding CsgD family transcriptional regulator
VPLLSHRLVGRDRDVSFLRSFVAEAAEDGGALLVTGEPGVGKSALLSMVAGDLRRDGVRVLRAAGAEFEAALSFGGLSQLLGPVLGQLVELDELDQRALRVSLGLVDGAASEERAVAIATLRFLTVIAAAQPVLAVVDDVNWLDRASSSVLTYVARRVGGTRIALIASMRTGERTPFERGGLDTYELEPLSQSEADALLQERFPSLTPRTRGRLLAEAQGNPLALLELPIALNIRGGTSGVLPRVLPLTERLERLFATRIEHLPAVTRDLLLLAVLDGTGDLAVLDPDCDGLDALAPAERSHVAYVDDATGRLAFHHPMVRSAIIQRSTSSQRRHAHQVLADRRRDDPERLAWHLAEAAVEPDEQVAALLEQVAHQHLRRGDAVAAIAGLLRAAQLSPSGEQRSVRLAQAAYLGASIDGDLAQVPRLLEQARRSDPEHAGALAGAMAGAYYLLNGDGEIDLAHRLLVGAIESLPDPSESRNEQLDEALYTLLGICFFGGRPELFAPLEAALARLKPRPPELLEIVARTFGDPVRADAGTFARLDRQVDRLSIGPTPARTVRVGRAAAYVDRLPGCRPALRRIVDMGREGDATTSAIEALFLLGNDAYFTGRWDEAEAVVDEGLGLCDEYGYRVLSWPGVFLRGLLAAARGDSDTALGLSDDMVRWAKPRGAGAILTYASHVRTVLALGHGDYEIAFQHVSGISPPGVLPSHAPHVLWVIGDLVEAAVRTNRRADAQAHVEALNRARVAEISPRLTLAVKAAAAMTASEDVRHPYFDRALSTPDIGRWPFEHARLLLAYGEYLRRARATGEARVHLGRGLEGFRVLGARPWMDKAASELRAAGSATGRPPTDVSVSLTPQQLEIAQLAAQGLTNKQIGERLFLSHRTVATHLYQLYPKLGIASRAALSDALATIAPQPEAAAPPDQLPRQ